MVNGGVREREELNEMKWKLLGTALRLRAEHAPYGAWHQEGWQMRHHDLVIIGTGSGNTIVDDSFADLDVAIVEERKFGGTCANYGCIPSKMLAYTADVADTVDDAGRFNIDANLRAVHWAALRDRVFDRTDGIELVRHMRRRESTVRRDAVAGLARALHSDADGRQPRPLSCDGRERKVDREGRRVGSRAENGGDMSQVIAQFRQRTLDCNRA